ncbi:MAG TPA: hypothetical protein VMG40_04590 [Bryobacteraceae bacterium]|nr:hypothetical protein [Bryobacteraceae bacterium]
MLLRSSIALLVAGACGVANAAVVTACTQGCTYPNFQSAINAATKDCAIDVIELTAGETYSGAFRFHPRACEHPLTVRSSRWRELPALGYRIDPARDAALLAVVSGANTSYPTIEFGLPEMLIVAADPAAGTIDLDGFPTSNELAVGTAISCSDRGNGLGPEATPQPGLPAPIERNTRYFITAIGSVQGTARRGVTLSLKPGGPPIHISNTDGINSPSKNYYAQPECALWNNASNIVLRGLDIRPADPGAGKNIGPATVTVGGSESAVDAMPAHIRIEQSAIRGNPQWRDRGAPRMAIFADGRDLTIQDSYMEALAFREESKCIAITQGRGVTVRNNTCASPGALLLSGGTVPLIKTAETQDLTVTGNFAVTPGRMFYMEGSGPPKREPCYFESGSGAFYRDKSVAPNTCANGGCYECSAQEQWVQNRSAVYRADPYLPKTRLELKSCRNCKITGNVFRGDLAGGDTGNTGCMALVLTEQSAIDQNGVFFTDHRDIVFENNWCDRVWSGILVGQVGPTTGPGPYRITGIKVVDPHTFEVSLDGPHSFGNYTYLFFEGIQATGTMGQLNGRWAYPAGFPDKNTVRVSTQAPLNFPADGEYTSGGTVRGTRWPVGRNEVVRNNLITRIGQFPQLSQHAHPEDALSRPLRIYNGVEGGPEVTKLTIRMDKSGRPQFGVAFESIAMDRPHPNAIFRDSILAAYKYPAYLAVKRDCSADGFGTYFSSPENFSNLLEYGPAAGWPDPGRCAGRLETARDDEAVNFVGEDQSIVENSKLVPSSRYSASNRSAKLVNSDGSDLGADIDVIAEAVSGAIAGTPRWSELAGVKITASAQTATLSYNAPDAAAACQAILYTAPARIEKNIHADTQDAANQADSRPGNTVDGVHRTFVFGAHSPLSPATHYGYLLQCGKWRIPGEFQTAAQ